MTRDTLMGTTRKTITVTDQQDQWIKAQIVAGAFTNDSEYIRDLIRRDQANQTGVEAIRAALVEAEQSIKTDGYSTKSVNDIMQEVLKRKGLDGKLQKNKKGR